MVWCLLLALATVVAPGPHRVIQLEIRVFDGHQEVTADTRVAVHRAGERTDPVARPVLRDGRMTIDVPEGIYDVQVIREREGRVLTIRWAERLVVMPYPDEDGRHLEVVNLKTGFGALQVRTKGVGTPPYVALFEAGTRQKEAAPRLTGPDYALFVVPAGRYDLRARAIDREHWHAGIDVPADRTRLWLLR